MLLSHTSRLFKVLAVTLHAAYPATSMYRNSDCKCRSMFEQRPLSCHDLSESETRDPGLAFVSRGWHARTVGQPTTCRSGSWALWSLKLDFGQRCRCFRNAIHMYLFNPERKPCSLASLVLEPVLMVRYTFGAKHLRMEGAQSEGKHVDGSNCRQTKLKRGLPYLF